MYGKSRRVNLLFILLLCALWLAACGSDTVTVAPTPTKLVHTESVTTPPTLSPVVSTSTVASTTAVITTVPVPATTAAITTAPARVISGPTDFSATLAFEHVRELAGKIGVRYVDSPGHEKGADYLELYFKDLGFRVVRPLVSYSTSDDKGSFARYSLNGTPTEIKANAVNYSGSGAVKGPLVYAGFGLDGQIPSGSLKGKIALIMRGEIPFEQKVANARKNGALGVIFFNNVTGELDTATLAGQADIPVIGLSQANGQKLRDLLNTTNGNLEVEVEVKIEYRTIDISNVVGVRAAAKEPASAPVLIIGGHFDSVAAGPGANDNASGTAVVLELARVLKNKYPNYELRFIGFGGEEIGLIGSTEYVKGLNEAERKRIVAMVNIDMIAVGDTMLLGGSPELTKLAFGAASEVGVGNVQGTPPEFAGASDHAPFISAGIPALFLNRQTDPNYHRAGDTSDKVQARYLELTGQIVIKVIEKLATS